MVVPRPSSARPSTAASRPIYGAPAPSSGLSLYDQRPKSPEVGRPRRSAAYPAASAPRPTFGAADRGGSGSSAAWNAGTAAKPRSPVRGPPPRATPSSWGENGHSSNNGTYGRDYRNNGYRRPTPPRSKAPPASSFGGGDQRKAPTPPRSKAQPSARHQWRPEPQEKPAYRDEEDDHHYNGNYGRYGEPEEDPAPQEEAEDFGADGDRREDEADVDAEGDFAYWDQAGAAFEDQDGMMNGEEAGAEGADDNFDDFEHFPQEEAPPEEDAYDEGEFDRAPEEEMGCEDEHWGEEQAEPVEGEDEVVAEDGIWADEEQDGKYDGLDSVPDHMRESAEAVEGNLALKRALSADTPGDNPAAKRRKLEDGSPKTDMQAIRTLLAGWRLEACRASKYVLQLATPSELKVLQRNRFKPNPNHRRTICEQIHDEVLRTRERESMPASSTVDAVDAFMQRWKNNVTSRDQDGRALRALSHRDLRSLLHEYDGSVPLSKQLDSLEELPPAPAEEDGSGTAAQEKPGCFTLGRSNRLELMDPFADALVVGDANLTFSLQLAAHRKALHHSGKVYATTFEKIETLRERYPEIDTTVKKLQDYGAEVIHDVDCIRRSFAAPRRRQRQRAAAAALSRCRTGALCAALAPGRPPTRLRRSLEATWPCRSAGPQTWTLNARSPFRDC
eukprot:TRINITY_DN2971_c0_g1_i1.p1 TRINITY_DN2971_c0_g1~~TRINITY_DN2971_c0_g1_i1.p1  ORF type:complete len:695 (+),score=126.77 TRINITY_DN2971_c0_g1_i1:72-2087(+)